MRIDPQLRRRAPEAGTRSGVGTAAPNAELVAAFAASLVGKVVETTRASYVSHVRDADAYARSANNGVELPFRAWTRETVWAYVHYVEANYCASFVVVNFVQAQGVMCRQKRWTGRLSPEAALKAHCEACPLFRSSRMMIGQRLNSLNKLFKFLARAGVVSANFVRDIVSEHHEDHREEPAGERRRNPTVEEVRALVNGTAHPRNRAYYAAAAKWWFRPNEMLLLDRQRSFPGFEEGNDVALIPSTKGALDKRKGNRIGVIDAELRPILQAYFQWWDAHVRRDATGQPRTTSLWITDRGNPIPRGRAFYETFFYADCERLGLMQPGDREDSLRRWTAHCMRHFGEKLLMMNNCPDTWAKHFRGDAIRDARGHYFVPTAEQIREKYHEWVPPLALSPVPLADLAQSRAALVSVKRP